MATVCVNSHDQRATHYNVQDLIRQKPLHRKYGRGNWTKSVYRDVREYSKIAFFVNFGPCMQRSLITVCVLQELYSIALNIL